MTHEDSFPSEKRHKEAFEAPCVCFNVLPEVFRQDSEKVTFQSEAITRDSSTRT